MLLNEDIRKVNIGKSKNNHLDMIPFSRININLKKNNFLGRKTMEYGVEAVHVASAIKE